MSIYLTISVRQAGISASWCVTLQYDRPVFRHWLRYVVSFLLEEKGVCESINMQSLIGIGPVAMNVLANIQMKTSVIYV